MAAIVCGVMMRNWYGRSIVDPAGEQAGDRRDSVDAGRVTDDRQALPSDDADSGWGGLLRPTGGAPNMKTSIAQRTASVDMAMPESMLMADTSETI